MTVVVFAKWVARDGEESAVAAAIARLVGPSRAEPGCLEYQPYRDADDPGVFMIYERYVDRAAYDAHTSSEHFRRYAVEDGIPRLAARERIFGVPYE